MGEFSILKASFQPLSELSIKYIGLRPIINFMRVSNFISIINETDCLQKFHMLRFIDLLMQIL